MQAEDQSPTSKSEDIKTLAREFIAKTKAATESNYNAHEATLNALQGAMNALQVVLDVYNTANDPSFFGPLPIHLVLVQYDATPQQKVIIECHNAVVTLELAIKNGTNDSTLDKAILDTARTVQEKLEQLIGIGINRLLPPASPILQAINFANLVILKGMEMELKSRLAANRDPSPPASAADEQHSTDK